MTSSNVPQTARYSRMGAIFGQFYPGGPIISLGQCISTDALPDPKPGKDPDFCIMNGQVVQIGSRITDPSLPNFTLTTVLDKAANWLEIVMEAECPFNLFFTLADCKDITVFGNRQRAYGYTGAIITDSPVNSPTMRTPDTLIEQVFNITTNLNRASYREMTMARIATIETGVLNSITACAGQCAGACGGQIGICQNLWGSIDTVAAAVPDLLRSIDSGATFTSPASIFAATESVKATVCIEFGTTSRVISVRDGDIANPLEIQYTDDGAATATLVVVGATANEAAVGGSSLFAFDANNIWLATDDGRVFYSSDQAQTWTDQTTALAASGAAALNAIHFATALIGYAVGAGDVIIRTLDGGATWAAMTATGSGDGLDTVRCFDANRVIVGTDSAVSASPVYMSFDATATWTTITLGLGIAATDTVAHIAFMDDGMTGILLKNTAAPVGTAYRSIDGGRSWKALNAVTNSGLTFAHICHKNLFYVVGLVNAATSFIARISG